MKKREISFFDMFVISIFFGVLVKLLDIYTANIGEIFSQISIWILIGVLIVIYSKTVNEAMIRIFVFCFGMLIGYYITAEITNSVYGINYIIGWGLFSLFTPILAYFVWFTKNKNLCGIFISIAILFATIILSIILYDGLRVYDFLILGILIYLLFLKKYYNK